MSVEDLYIFPDLKSVLFFYGKFVGKYTGLVPCIRHGNMFSMPTSMQEDGKRSLAGQVEFK